MLQVHLIGFGKENGDMIAKLISHLWRNSITEFPNYSKLAAFAILTEPGTAMSRGRYIRFAQIEYENPWELDSMKKVIELVKKKVHKDFYVEEKQSS